MSLGSRLSRNPEAGPNIANSFLLGIGTGLLWAPCAGPILGIILTTAALGGASARTVLLLLVYATGAATSLAIALLAGSKAFTAMKRSLGAEEWIRRALGVAILAGVVAVAFGLDRGILSRLSLASTSGFEQRLVDKFRSPGQPTGVPNDQRKNNPAGAMTGPSDVNGTNAPALEKIAGATAWINSAPLSASDLRGKVVLVDFWTYSCINCLRTLPYIKAWNEKYKNDGLVIIGVHTPEFAFEKDEANVRKAVKDLGITYPVAMDNNYRIWRNFQNEYWPADYLIDAQGHVRDHTSGKAVMTNPSSRFVACSKKPITSRSPEPPAPSPPPAPRPLPTPVTSFHPKPTSATSVPSISPPPAASIKTPPSFTALPARCSSTSGPSVANGKMRE